MKLPFQTTRRVEFRDTDAAGIVHFSMFFAYMEEAEHAMLRELGLNVILKMRDQTISWPRVAASCDFRKPARFEDELVVTVRVKRIGEKSVTYGFEFQLDESLIAEGSLTAACCRVDGDDAPHAVAIPSEIADKLKVTGSD